MHKNAAVISDSICQACDRFYTGYPHPLPLPPPVPPTPYPLMPAAFCLGKMATFRYLGHFDFLLSQIWIIPSEPGLHPSYSSA